MFLISLFINRNNDLKKTFVKGPEPEKMEPKKRRFTNGTARKILG